MLTIYRRHKEQCSFADDRISKKCRCSLWATGTLDGNPYHKSLKTRSFERAQQPGESSGRKTILYQQKTGVPVRVPLPPDLAADTS